MKQFGELGLKNLYNPNKINGVLLKNGNFIKASEIQGFQTYPKSVELWEMVDHRLMRVARWLSKSIICTYKKVKK